MEKTFSRREHPGRCDVCGKEGPVVVNRSIFGPFDFSYCEECFRTGAEPYWFTVSTAASMNATKVDYVFSTKQIIDFLLKLA